MRPIIVDMNEMSDSTEVYESRPNRFLIYTIYVIFALLVTALIWMGLSKMEVVVKSDGMFRSDGEVYEVGSGVTGIVKECLVENGQKVEKGDVLFTVENESLNESIQTYENRLNEIEERIAILEAYQKSLDGDADALDEMKDNPYYEEILNRKLLFEKNKTAGSENTQGKMDIYRNSISEMEASIEQSQTKISKLQQAKEAVYSRTNTFGEEDSYYSSIVSSYMSGYNLTAGQYDARIKEYQTGESPVEEKIAELEREKEEALANLEFQQISGVEQLIETAENTLNSQKSGLASVKAEMNAAKNSDTPAVESIQLLTEKGQAAAEILSCQKEASECESYLRNYKIQGENCNILAGVSGYFYQGQELPAGAYIQEGTSVGTVYPEKNGGYYADIYVDNSDIGKLEKGQKVKFEIPAYPSSEYGYFTGEIVDIPKDISVDQNNGSAYYMVKAVCDSNEIQNKSGKTAEIMNGMACQARMIVEEKSVLKYVLEKIDLVD